MSALRWCGVAGLLTLVVSCTFAPESRYEQAQDTAPLKPISAADVADAQPRPDPILSAGNKSPYEVNGVTYEVLSDHRGYRQHGIASWYGAKFDGHETSNGEIFDVYRASAAHRTLPIPSYAKVTNLDNGQSVVVRINDRGPFHSARLIDLSYAAAVKLGFAAQGTAPVEVAVIEVTGVDDRRGLPLGDYRYLQIGAFGVESSAEGLKKELQTLLGEPVFVSPVDASGKLLYRVRVGPVSGNKKLRALQIRLEDNGYTGAQPLP
ncbi:MAG: rare lipoprotein A [Bacteroidia bacterium]|jgi:rare lipoprotein A